MLFVRDGQTVALDRVELDRFAYVLKVEWARRRCVDIGLIANLGEHLLRDQNSARWAQALDPRGDVDGVTRGSELVELYITLMDPDADRDLWLLTEGLLKLSSCFDRVHGAWEDAQATVAEKLKDFAASFRDDPFQSFSVPTTGVAGYFLVLPHHSRIAHHIGEHHRGKATTLGASHRMSARP